jgi:hypothetical protein
LNAASPRNGRRTTQLTRTDWPRPVSVTAGSQRHERAGWNGPAPLLSLLAAGSNALAPHGRGKGRDMPRRRTTLTPAGGGTGSSNPFPSSRESGELSVPKRRDPICPKAELEDRQALFVVNLAPRKMAGQISEAMLLDIGYADGITPVLAIPEQPIPNGVRAG